MSKWFELEHLAGLRLTGRGARAFAQAQFTADMSSMAADLWYPLAWCDPKGRVVALMLANAGEDAVELILPASQFDPVRSRLTLFAIGHEVTLAGPETVAGRIDAKPGDPLLAFDRSRGLSISGQAGKAETARVQRWRLCDMACGLAWLQAATSGRHLPQFLGLEALGAISYRKGCYPGQEIIARLHYLGKVKHGLFGLRLDQSTSVEPCSEVTTTDGKVLGEVLDVLSPDQHAVGLAVLKANTRPGERIEVVSTNTRIPGQVTTPEGLC